MKLTRARKPGTAGRRRRPSGPVAAAAVLILGLGGLMGWAATKPPLPDPLPVEVALPEHAPGAAETAEAPADPAAEGAEMHADVTMNAVPAMPGAAAEDTRPALTPTEVPTDAAALRSRAKAMQPSPHPALIENGRYGLLPVVAADGRQSWQVYARPFDDSDPRPRIGVVMTGLGMTRSATFKALQSPGAVTLSFSPYANGLEEWGQQARAAGHEILLELPMEPLRFPDDDPGPRALLTSLGPNQNLDRLSWLLSRFAGYIGVTGDMGGRFVASELHMRSVLGEVKRRGLMYLDRRGRPGDMATQVAETIGLLRIGADIDVDARPSRADIAQRLDAAVALAQRDGGAVVMVRPYPVTFELLRGWFAKLEEDGIALAPLTAVVQRRKSGTG